MNQVLLHVKYRCYTICNNLERFAADIRACVPCMNHEHRPQFSLLVRLSIGFVSFFFLLPLVSFDFFRSSFRFSVLFAPSLFFYSYLRFYIICPITVMHFIPSHRRTIAHTLPNSLLGHLEFRIASYMCRRHFVGTDNKCTERDINAILLSRTQTPTIVLAQFSFFRKEVTVFIVSNSQIVFRFILTSPPIQLLPK